MNVIINYDTVDHIYIVCGKTDLRKGIDGLAEIIRSDYDYDPFSSALFLFCGSNLDRFKALYWDGYSVYNIPRLTQVHCLSHIRRKFTDASHTKHTTSEAVNGVN